jgi:uncharacterized membrane protein YdbT with pleckstrin-like domain
MFERLRALLLRLLRVPSEPSPPAGSREVRVFRAAPNYFRYKLILWAFAQLSALVGLAVGSYFFFRFIGRFDGFVASVGPWLELGAWAIFLVQIPFSYALLRLDFEMRWYLISDRSLRIRQGVVSLREKTMTYANVQQIVIRQNPLQRLLGLYDVQVRSAGGGGGQSAEAGKGQVGESMHEAWFRGVGNAEAIRTAIRERVKRHRDTGLGDPDETPLLPRSAPQASLEAARELRDEMRELRLALLGSSTESR